MNKFIQITASEEGLYALDEEGNVWKYIPAAERRVGTRYAFWSKLTGHQAGENQK